MLRSALSLLSISGLLVSLAEPVQAGSVTWLTPSKGDVYNPGDTLVGRWTSHEPDPSLSFRLCVKSSSRRSDDSEDDDANDGDDSNEDDNEDDNSGAGGKQSDDGDGSCGKAVWPTIEQSGTEGSYSVQMALPNATSVSQCYLQMVGDNDHMSSSPIFSFGSSGADDQSAAAADEADSTDAVPSSDSSTASPASFSSSESSPSISLASSPSASPESSPSAPPASSASLNSSASPATSTSLTTSTSSSSSSPTASVSNANLQSTSSQPPSLNDTRMPAPVASYAVPLSLVLSVLLAAAGLSLHQRRKLRAERKLEHDALKSRATLSRHSTLSYAGFMALGRGPSPSSAHCHSASGQSRSTSVNLMRAWRRDVSRYDHSVPDDDDHTYVAKTSDARSVLSTSSHGSSHPKREPRPQTREPFYTSSSQARRTTVPAGLFRMGVSPMVPQPHRGDDDNDLGKLKRVDKPLPNEHGVNDGTLNASVNNEVMSRYFDFSPIPLSPPGPRDASRVSVPERLHVRKYAEDTRYDGALPPSPGVAENDLYDVVARKLSK